MQPINFAAHQTRSGFSGAREDFEQMLALLVQATRPTARLIAANPGDWGIDVVVGELDGGNITVFQAKYFYPVVESIHQQKIRDSFKAALAAAAEHGHRIARWTLCVPASMDAPTAKWWDSWKKRTAISHGVVIDLWDETSLRRELLNPRAVHVREHYYGKHVSQPAPSKATSDEIAAYLRSLTDYLGTGLDPYVPLSLTTGTATCAPESLLPLLRPGDHVSLTALSGNGKSHALLHTVVASPGEGWLPVFLRGGLYDGSLSHLIDGAVAPHTSRSAQELLTAAASSGRNALLVIDGLDGHDGCPERLRAHLIEQVAAFALRNDVTVIFGSQIEPNLPEALRGPAFHINAPDVEQREALRTCYGGPIDSSLYNPFDTAYEISLAARLAAQISPPATSAHLFDEFIRDRLRKAQHPTATRAVLRRLALQMDEQLASSLPLSDVQRFGEQALAELHLSPTVLDELLASPVVRIEDGRLMFAHEQLARFLVAEEIARTCREATELERHLTRPRHDDLATLILPLERSTEHLQVLIQVLGEQELVNCLQGQLGAGPQRAAHSEAQHILNEETAALSTSTVDLGPDLYQLTISGGRPRSEYEEKMLEAIGKVLTSGLLLTEVLALLEATESACLRGTDRRPRTGQTNGAVISALVGLGQRGVKGLAASTVLAACEMGRFGNHPNPRSDLSAFRSTLADSIESCGRAVQYFACLLFLPSEDGEPSHLALKTAKACWETGEYHLQLAALDLARYSHRVTDEYTRLSTVEWLEAIPTPENLFLSTALVETLNTYGLIDTGTTAEDVNDHVSRVLQQPESPEARGWASYIVASQFEDVISTPYFEALESLPSDQYVALLTMAALSGEDSFTTDWTLQRLINCNDRVALPAFEYWSARLDASTPYRRGEVLCHTLGVQGRATFEHESPRLAEHPSRDGDAWRHYDTIIHWIHRPGLSESEVQERCSASWDALTADLATAAVDPLYQLRHSRMGALQPDRATHPKILKLFPVRVAGILERGLSNLEGLTSIFSPTGERSKIMHEYIITTLGDVGSEDTIRLLSSYAEDPEVGAAAVAAIRKIKRTGTRRGAE